MSSLACILGAGNVDPAILEFLHRSGQVQDKQAWAIEPLTGGVASDIWKVTTNETSFVVKKALASLRVAQDWKAPVTRNASEVEWMLEAAKVAPNAVPRILAHDPSLGAFAMTYFNPSENPVWKEELRNGRVDVTFARRLGALLRRSMRRPRTRKISAAGSPMTRSFTRSALSPILKRRRRCILILLHRFLHCRGT